MTSVLPANSFQPLFHTSIGEDAIDLCAVCGLFLDDWQQQILSCSLSMREDERFAARKMVLLVPRQQGKNVVLEARELAGLFLLKEPVMLHTAQQYRTAQAAYVRLQDRILHGAKYLLESDRIQFRSASTGTSITCPKSRKRRKSFLQFAPRGPNTGRGLTVNYLAIDEAYAYDTTEASALEFTQNQSDNPQLWITSSTGFPDSHELLAAREMGLAKTSNVGFFEYKADDDTDPGDRDQWFKALPGLVSGRQRLDEIVGQYEKAKALGDFADFDREIRGLWATTDIPALISAPLWESLKYPEGTVWVPPKEFAFAVDVQPVPEGSSQVPNVSVYACGQDEFGFYHVWNVAADEGTGWVAEFLKIQQEQRKPRVTVLDPMSPAGVLIPSLDAAGVQWTGLTSAQCMAACSQFEAVVRDGRLRHGDDGLLAGAVSQGVQRMIGQKGVWLWARKSVEADISPLVSASYAMFGVAGVEAAVQRTGGWW